MRKGNRRCPFLFAHRRGYGVVPAAGAATFPPPAGGASLAEVQRKLSAPSGRTACAVRAPRSIGAEKGCRSEWANRLRGSCTP